MTAAAKAAAAAAAAAAAKGAEDPNIREGTVSPAGSNRGSDLGARYYTVATRHVTKKVKKKILHFTIFQTAPHLPPSV